MAHIYKKFSTEQAKILLTSYQRGHISRSEIEKILGTGRTGFFGLLKLLNEVPYHSRLITSVATNHA